MHDKLIDELIDTLSDRLTPEKVYQFRETLANLSLDSRTICDIVFNSPVEFAKLIVCGSPKETRGELARILREERGWVWARIWNSFREIKITLKRS